MSAIRRRKSAAHKPMSEINVVPYIDVMLVLLVIFMITAPMLTQGVTVDLPKATSENLKTADKEPIIVSVSQSGEFFLNISTTPNEAIEAQALMVRVAAELELAKQTNQPIRVLVKGDQNVPYGKVVEAMALLKQAGSDQVGLMTESPHSESKA
jgi:biopolymer transport protein TolR